ADHGCQKAKTHARFKHRERAGGRGIGNNIAVSQRKKCFSAVVKQASESYGFIAELEVLASAKLQQGKSVDEPDGPQAKKNNQRKRPEVAQHVFSSAHRLDVAANGAPEPPGLAIEKAAQSELPLHATRQHDTFKGIQQDTQDDDRADND